MPPSSESDDDFPREELERLEALANKLDRTIAEMRDLRAKYVALAERERLIPTHPRPRRDRER